MLEGAAADSSPDKPMEVDDITEIEGPVTLRPFALAQRWIAPPILPTARSPFLLRSHMSAMRLGAAPILGQSSSSMGGNSQWQFVDNLLNPIIFSIDHVPAEDCKEPFDFTNDPNN